MDTQHGKLTLSKYIGALLEYDESKLEKVKLYSEEAYKNSLLIHLYKWLVTAVRKHLRRIYPKKKVLGVNSFIWNLAKATDMSINYKKYFNNPSQPGKKRKPKEISG